MSSLIILLIFLLPMLCIPWTVHISMVKSNCKIYGWGNYKKFKREFAKYNWDNWYPDSLDDQLNRSEIFASKIIFDNKGMIINNPFSYYLVHRFVKRKLKKFKSILIKW